MMPPPSPTARAAGHPTSPQPSVSYLLPLKKHNERQVIDTVDGFHEFIGSNDLADQEVRMSVRIQVHLLWTIGESVRGLHFLRLYLGEQQSPETLQQQQQEYQGAQCGDPFQANQFLIMISLYEVAPDNPILPPLVTIVSLTPTKLRL